jgi:tetratricopeptide (TPR) repeat protein
MPATKKEEEIKVTGDNFYKILGLEEFPPNLQTVKKAWRREILALYKEKKDPNTTIDASVLINQAYNFAKEYEGYLWGTATTQTSRGYNTEPERKWRDANDWMDRETKIKFAGEVNDHFLHAQKLAESGKLNEAEKEFLKVYEVHIKYGSKMWGGAISTMCEIWEREADKALKTRKFDTAREYLMRSLYLEERFGKDNVVNAVKPYTLKKIEELDKAEKKYKSSFRHKVAKMF